jgi:hypothetical protein
MFFWCELSILPGNNAGKKNIALIYCAAMNPNEIPDAVFASFSQRECGWLLYSAATMRNQEKKHAPAG